MMGLFLIICYHQSLNFYRKKKYLRMMLKSI